MKPVPILLCAGMVIAVVAGGAFQYSTRKVTLPVYAEPVTFFSEEKQGLTLASLPVGVSGMGAEACAKCHQSEYREWKASAHSRSVTEPVFASAFKTEPRFVCRSCHSPLLEQQPQLLLQARNPHVLLNGRLEFENGVRPHLSEPNPHYSRELSAEGVTCVTCHVREGTILTANPKARANVPHPLSYAPLMAKAEYCGGCHQFDLASPGSHPFEHSPPRTTRSDQQFAKAARVRFVQPASVALATQNAPGNGDTPVQPDPGLPPIPPSPGLEGQYHQEARVQHTLEEFRISPAALKGESCQSCHMPRREGGGAHSWPGRNELAMLQKAVSLTARLDKAAYRSGEKLQAVIRVKNDAGHRFPTGDSLHAGVLDVWLCDGNETLGRETFLMASQGGGFGATSLLVNEAPFSISVPGSQVRVDLRGQPVESVPTLDAPQRADTRLLPGEDALFVYHQKVTPAVAQAKNLTLRVRVFHSAVHPGLKRSAIDPGMETMRLVREQVLPVRIERTPVKDPKTAMLPTSRRRG